MITVNIVTIVNTVNTESIVNIVNEVINAMITTAEMNIVLEEEEVIITEVVEAVNNTKPKKAMIF